MRQHNLARKDLGQINYAHMANTDKRKATRAPATHGGGHGARSRRHCSPPDPSASASRPGRECAAGAFWAGRNLARIRLARSNLSRGSNDGGHEAASTTALNKSRLVYAPLPRLLSVQGREAWKLRTCA